VAATSSPGELTFLAAGIAERIETWRRRKLPLSELTRMAVDVDPSLATAATRRARLAESVDELVDAEIVSLPSTGAYDRTALPHLPRFVWLERERAAPARTPGHTVPWPPQLEWASDLMLTDEHLALLRRVAEFLRAGGLERPVAPIRERSLELLGDEKRLEALLTGSLFSEGRLTLDLLRCRVVRPPFVFTEVGPAPTLLVVENHTTFDTLRYHLSGRADAGLLAFGAGRQFEATVEYVAELPRRVETVTYFGDLDDPGLAIPLNASRNAERHGLPAAQPAAELYRLLFEHGTRARWERRTTDSRARRLTGWLPDDLRGAARELLVEGQRLAQEAVTGEALRAACGEAGAVSRR
jgi:hypothetical protein